MLGRDDNCSYIDFSDLNESDFESARAKNSYAVMDDDATSVKMSDDDMSELKKMLGSGGLAGAKKYNQNEDFDPFATVILNLNNAMLIGSESESIESRILPIWFESKFVSDPDPEAENEYEKRLESELESELKTDEQIQGLINEAIRGANQLRENGEYTIERHMGDDLIDRYKYYSDTTARFFSDFFVESEEECHLKKSDVYELYVRFAEDLGIDPQYRDQFWRQAKNSASVYIEEGSRNAKPYKGDRTITSLKPTPKALEYAPGPLRDRLEDVIESKTPKSCDEITPIKDIDYYDTFVSIKGRVVGVEDEVHSDGVVSRLGVVDGDHSIKIAAGSDDAAEMIDGIEEGDVVRFKRVEVDVSDSRVLITPSLSEVTVLATDQDSLLDVDGGSDGGSDSDGKGDVEEVVESRYCPDRVTNPGDILILIAEATLDGTPVSERVLIDVLVDEYDLSEEYVRDALDKLHNKGEIRFLDGGVVKS